MVDAEPVTLEPAPPESEGVLSNLLALYVHDLSEIFPIEVGADGRFRYDRLPLYWSEPERRFPFLIRAGAKLAGFALAARGSPASDDPDALDVAEFFVLRGYRRSGVGQPSEVGHPRGGGLRRWKQCDSGLRDDGQCALGTSQQSG